MSSPILVSPAESKERLDVWVDVRRGGGGGGGKGKEEGRMAKISSSSSVGERGVGGVEGMFLF